MTNFLQIVLMGKGLPAFFFFFFFFFALLQKDFEGFIDIFRLYGVEGGEVGGPPPENFGKFRMQEKPSTTFFRLILYIFIFH